MIAQVSIQLPFILNVTDFENVELTTFFEDGYEISFYPFLSHPDRKYGEAIIKINGKVTHYADILHIVFMKEDFERRELREFDPPESLIEKVANDFLLRLRYVTNNSIIKPICDFSTTWKQVHYFNDDWSKITDNEADQIIIRMTDIKSAKVSPITEEVWNDVNSLEPFSITPSWNKLLLDSNAVLPEIGPAIILAFTSLEAFISNILDMAARYKQIDSGLWDWFYNNAKFNKKPTIEDQFGFLCKYLLGESIKDTPHLWTAFKKLQEARNTFAHRGVSKIDGVTVDLQLARDLIVKAKEIIEFVRNILPEELKWKVYNYDIAYEVDIPLK